MKAQHSSPVRVLKFGGTSVGSPDRIVRVARIVASHHKSGESIVVVVSAMGDTTDELVALAAQVSGLSSHPSRRREMDMLLTTGERISMALLSMALADLGLQAVSLTGSQSGIVTTSEFGDALIKEIRPIRILQLLAAEKIVIVAGFQGVSEEKEITTLGRGGSDTSAVALAIALGAEQVIIYTDVDGFFSADPRRVPAAHKIEQVSWELALEGASRGAQVLHPRCVELAWKFKMPVTVCTSIIENAEFARANAKGTRVFSVEKQQLESSKVLNVSIQNKLCLATIEGFVSPLDVEVFFGLMSTKGFHAHCWNLKGTKMALLFDEKYREPLKGQKIIEERSPLTRISLLGPGLGRDILLVKGVCQLLSLKKIALLEFNQSATAVDFIIESQSQELEDEILQALHKKFVE